MNVLTDPWIPVMSRGGQDITHISYKSLMTEQDPDLMLSSPDPMLEPGLVLLLSQLTESLFGGRDIKDVDKTIMDAAPMFEMYGDGPRFMQCRLPEEHRTTKSGIDLYQELILYRPGSTTETPFGHERWAENPVLCHQCAPLVLFTYQQFVPGAGGKSSGLLSDGTLTYLVGGSAFETVVANTLPPTIMNPIAPYEEHRLRLENRSPSEAFPWLDEDFLAMLREGRQNLPENMRNLRYTQWWMSRATWLNPETSEHPRVCFGCRKHTTQFIATAEMGRKARNKDSKSQKADPDRGKDNTAYFGLLKNEEFVPSHLTAFKQSLKENKVGKWHLGGSVRMGSPFVHKNMLISAASALLERGTPASNDKAEFYAAAVVREASPNPRTLAVFSVILQNSAFSEAILAHLPFETEPRLAWQANNLCADLEKFKGRLYSSVAQLVKACNRSKPEDAAAADSNRLINDANHMFMNFLRPDAELKVLAEWRDVLYRRARAIFSERASLYQTHPAAPKAIGNGLSGLAKLRSELE